MKTKSALLTALLLTACTPEEEPPAPGTSSESTSRETDETGDETGETEDSWGIVLDVAPPYYGTETETGDES